MKSNNDQALEALFYSEPIRDDGFSKRVVQRVRLRLRVQRLIVPVALVVGGLLAFKPLIDVIEVLNSLAAYLPANLSGQVLAALPSLSTGLTTVAIIVAVVCIAPMLDD